MKKIQNILNSNFLLIFIIPLFLALFLLFNKPAYQQQYPRDYDLQVLPLVLQYLNRYYVDEAKIDPNQMLIDGLNKLEGTLDEVLVVFADPENGSNFTIFVNNNSKEYKNLEIYDLESLGDIMQDVFAFIIPHLKNDDLETIDIEYVVTDKMLKTLDQHSGIITPDVYKEFMIETEGSFGGLGIVIGIRDGQLTVISPIEGTPAYNAGIKPNDKIVQIENESTINMSLIEAVSKLRGKKGTSVNIFVLRESFDGPKKFAITRDTIKIESVEDFTLDNDILYLRIRDFQKNTLDSLADAIDKRDNINGIILDLRGNPGGLLDQAEKVSDLFLTKGTVVTTKVGNSRKSYNARYNPPEFEGKVVVLVDSGSASASEIVAGALKNNQRAVIIGERTFGKGSVQQIFDLRDGSALKLTIANYLTPGDISIQDIGITPDIKLEPAIITEDDIIFDRPEEEDSNGNGQVQFPVYELKYLEVIKSPEEEETPDEALTKEARKEKLLVDFSVLLAKEIILSSNNLNRELVLDKSKQIIADISLKEESKIENRWNELGVNWSRGEEKNKSPELGINLTPKDLEFNAGEKGSVTVSVTNNSDEPIYRLMAITASDNPIFDGKELIFGKLMPEETRSWSMKFDIPKWVNTRNDQIMLNFYQSGNVQIPDYGFDITTLGKPKPLFAYNYEIVDDGRFQSAGNGNSRPETEEHVSLVFNIKNIGNGTSDKTVITLKNLSGDSVFLERGRVELTDFKPQMVKSAPFMFRVTSDKLDDVKFELNVIDEVFREVVTSKIDITGIQDLEKIATGSGSAVVINDDTPIRGGGTINAPITGFSSKNSVFELIGNNEKFVKVKLKPEHTGWISTKDVVITDDLNRNENEAVYEQVFYSQPKISISSIPLTTDKEEITISGSVIDSDTIENISVFRGEDKIKLLTPNKNNQKFSFKLKLDSGVNVFNIIAKDSQGLFSKKTVTVRKSDLS